MQVMEWSDLRYVLAVGRAGTRAGAARRLGVDQTTVARRLTVAEAALGTRLFRRVEGVLRPTAAGEAAIARAAGVEQEVAALERGISGADSRPAGMVRLTAVPIVVNRLLMPALPAFCAGHPGLRLEVAAEPRNLDLTRREADIAVRLARPERGAALAKRIGWLDYAVYGPRQRKAVALPWITYEEGLSHLPQARWIAAAARAGGLAPVALNDAETILQAISAGFGRSLLPCAVADGISTLRRMDGGPPALAREVWLLVHRELRSQARIAVTIDWLQSLVASWRPRGAQGTRS